MSKQRNKLTAQQAIREHYQLGYELTEKHEKIKERWSASFSLLCNYHSIQQAIPLLISQFKISEAQAYRDIRNAIQLFGDVISSSKEGHRYVIYEYAVKTFQLAAKNGDHKAMSQAVSNMIKLLGLDRDDPDIPEFEKLKPNVYPIVLDQQLEDTLKQLLSNPGSVNLSKLMSKDAQTVKYTDVEKEKQTE